MSLCNAITAKSREFVYDRLDARSRAFVKVNPTTPEFSQKGHTPTVEAISGPGKLLVAESVDR